MPTEQTYRVMALNRMHLVKAGADKALCGAVGGTDHGWARTTVRMPTRESDGPARLVLHRDDSSGEMCRHCEWHSTGWY